MDAAPRRQAPFEDERWFFVLYAWLLRPAHLNESAFLSRSPRLCRFRRFHSATERPRGGNEMPPLRAQTPLLNLPPKLSFPLTFAEISPRVQTQKGSAAPPRCPSAPPPCFHPTPIRYRHQHKSGTSPPPPERIIIIHFPPGECGRRPHKLHPCYFLIEFV